MKRATPEFELLCLTARRPLEPAHLARIRQKAGEGVRPDLLRRLIARHRVPGLVCDGLLKAGVRLDPATEAYLRGEQARAGLLELRSASAAAAIVHALKAEGIPVVLLKGPGVSLQAFGELGLRTNRDIDLLVPIAHRARAIAILDDHDYRRAEPAPEASAEDVADWFARRKDAVFRRPDGLCVELHWRLFDNPALLRELDTFAVQVVQSGRLCFDTMGQTETLIYLCAHGAQHAWSRLKWLADVTQLLRRLSEDQMRDLLREARRNKAGPSVGQAVLLASLCMDLPLASDLRRQLRTSPRIRWLTWTAQRCLSGGDARELEAQPFAQFLKNLSHYMIANGWDYWGAELRFDLFDLDAAGLPKAYRRYGPFARLVALFASFQRVTDSGNASVMK